MKTNYTIAEIRNPQRTKHNSDGKTKYSLWSIALEAIRPRFTAERNYVAALILDSHSENGRVTGNEALGGGGVNLEHSLGIFGSHTLFSWPTSFEEIIPSFMNTRPVDTNYLGIDGEGDTYWIAANVGIGAMLHEVGHAFGCPHQRSGVMMRDYIRLSRSFSVTEPPGPPALNGKECAWHRLDLLRFRAHPCFALPADSTVEKGGIPQIFGIDQGILVKSASALVVMEIFLEKNEFAKSWIEYVNQKWVHEVIISEEELRKHADGEGKIKINVIALNGQTASVDNVQTLIDGEEVPPLGKVWKTKKLEYYEGSPSTVLFHNESFTKLRIYSGRALDGIEFFTEEETLIFGERGGVPHDFILEDDEFITGFAVRSVAWIDALQIVTNQRRSQWFGTNDGGTPQLLSVPNNDHRICGIFGNIKQWVMQMGLMYCVRDNH